MASTLVMHGHVVSIIESNVHESKLDSQNKYKFWRYAMTIFQTLRWKIRFLSKADWEKSHHILLFLPRSFTIFSIDYVRSGLIARTNQGGKPQKCPKLIIDDTKERNKRKAWSFEHWTHTLASRQILDDKLTGNRVNPVGSCHSLVLEFSFFGTSYGKESQSAISTFWFSKRCFAFTFDFEESENS